MHLYMIRHGQSYVNLPEWNGGNSDEPLTKKGQRQAAALADWLPKNLAKVDVIYASTMLRARETAVPLAKAYGQEIIFDDRLREIGNNRLDHTPWPSDGLPEYGDYWGSERPFSSITPRHENGESLMHFRARLGMFIEDMIRRHRDEIVVAVCHGGVIELTFDHVFNIGPWRHCEVWTHNTGITHFEYVEHPRRESWRLRYHSQIEHLAQLRELPGKGEPEESKELRHSSE
ncbi:MAG: histidine phosphatase family protein [Anaerolineae bacterium]|nr:histidine phosphatase family protein [Anaerolineae bacterium]